MSHVEEWNFPSLLLYENKFKIEKDLNVRPEILKLLVETEHLEIWIEARP